MGMLMFSFPVGILQEYCRHFDEYIVSILGVYCEYIVLGDYDWLKSSGLKKTRNIFTHLIENSDLITEMLLI